MSGWRHTGDISLSTEGDLQPNKASNPSWQTGWGCSPNTKFSRGNSFARIIMANDPPSVVTLVRDVFKASKCAIIVFCGHALKSNNMCYLHTAPCDIMLLQQTDACNNYIKQPHYVPANLRKTINSTFVSFIIIFFSISTLENEAHESYEEKVLF